MDLNKVSYIYNIPTAIDESMVYTRLSYKKTRTILEPEIEKSIRSACAAALNLAKPSGAYMFVDLSEGEKSFIIDNLKIDNNLLREKLSGSIAYALIAVTLGKDIDEEITKLFFENEYTKAVIMDTAASCMVDAAVESLKQHINKLLVNENLELGKFRISPGQLDIPLSLQKAFYNKLGLEYLGLEINEGMMLTPMKSVISISAVKHGDSSFVSLEDTGA